jgi:hypothetical protein
MRLDGKLNVQCVAQGIIAPFTQNSSMFSDVGLNLNIIPLLQEMYNGPGNVKRIWPNDEYRETISKLGATMTAEEIINMHPKIAGAASAAGVFSNLGNAIGGLFGDTGARIGQGIGAIGDLGSMILGSASGEYAAESAGMYGKKRARAAGMYGRQSEARSAGMFGRPPRASAAGIYGAPDDDDDDDGLMARY